MVRPLSVDAHDRFYMQAAAVASVALCLAGIFHTAVCAAPPAQRLLRVLALDR